MTTPAQPTQVQIGSIWRSIHGRERVKVGRVWLWPGEGWAVRAHPTTGGRYLVAALDWFVENYALVQPAASPGPEGGAD